MFATKQTNGISILMFLLSRAACNSERDPKRKRKEDARMLFGVMAAGCGSAGGMPSLSGAQT